MKRLISLISTEGKTREEIVKKTWEAFKKYQKAEKKVSKSEENVPESEK